MTCKQAAEMLNHKEENKLSFFKKIQLRIHLLGCNMCALFNKQWDALTFNIKHDDCEHCLTEAEKDKLRIALNEIKVTQ